MGSRPEDVAIRLTPKGLDDVSRAFKTIIGDINRAGQAGKKSFGPLSAAASDLKRLLPAIGFAAAVTGLTSMAKSALDAADAVGKTAQKVGATAESVSILQFAAATADVSNEQLETGLIKLAKSMSDATDGAKDQVTAFRALGLSAKDLQNLDTGTAFGIIADKLGKVTDGSKKTDIALKLFGKSGAQLIPLLNDLAASGFDNVRAAAEKFGVVISSDTAAAAQQANDSMTTIGLQAKGLATQFIVGFAPSIANAMESFTQSTQGDGLASMKTFGQETGRVLRAVIGIFRLFGGIVGGVFKVLGQQLGALAAAIVQAFKGNFKEAGEILKSNFLDTVSTIKDTMAGALDNFDKLIDDVNRDPPEIKVKVKPNVEFGDFETADAQKKRETAAAKAAREKEAAAKKQAALEEKAGQALLDLQQQLSTLEGDTAEAKISNLNQELDKRREILKEAGKLNDTTTKLLEDVRKLGTAKINFDDLEGRIEREMQAFESSRAQIQSDIEVGIESQFGGQERLRALEQSRIPVLKELVGLLKAQAEAIGNQDALDKANSLGQSIDELDRSMKIATDNSLKFKQAVGDALQQGIQNILDGTTEVHNLGDAFRSLASTAVGALRQVASELLATYLRAQLLKLALNIASSFGGSGSGATEAGNGLANTGGTLNAATGGLVSGPGTGTSDSVAAWLSDGEHVTRAKAVQAPGVLGMLQYINRNARLPRGTPRFAGGGMVGKGPKSGGDSSGGLRIINVLDPTLVTSALGTPAGEKVIMNHIQRNASAIRRFIGDSSR